MKLLKLFILSAAFLILTTACAKSSTLPIAPREETQSPETLSSDAAPAVVETQAKAKAEVSLEAKPKTVTVQISDSGFLPAALAIQAGDTVNFVNIGKAPHWPASGVHPTHQLCPGFDPLSPLEPSQSWSFMFSAAKECPIHDHLNPSLRGKITVQ